MSAPRTGATRPPPPCAAECFKGQPPPPKSRRRKRTKLGARGDLMKGCGSGEERWDPAGDPRPSKRKSSRLAPASSGHSSILAPLASSSSQKATTGKRNAPKGATKTNTTLFSRVVHSLGRRPFSFFSCCCCCCCCCRFCCNCCCSSFNCC